MLSVGFETTIVAGERPWTYALDRAATGIGDVSEYLCINLQNIKINILYNEPTNAQLIYKLLYCSYTFRLGPGSSVSIATDYGLDGPGIESQWGRDFSHTSRPALGPTQPLVQWVPGHSRG
jgi:hypothetical protein